MTTKAELTGKARRNAIDTLTADQWRGLTDRERASARVDAHRLPLIERAAFWLRVQDAESIYPGIKIDDMTCYQCSDEPVCESAWDIYNTDGDCLESK